MYLSKIKTFFLELGQRLVQIRDTPHAIAGGVAIGVFMGFTPLLGFKTLLALLIAWLLRCSKVSAAVAVTAHDCVFPLLPLILRWQYIIGFWLWYSPHHLPKKLKLQTPTLEHLFDWHCYHLLRYENHQIVLHHLVHYRLRLQYLNYQLNQK